MKSCIELAKELNTSKQTIFNHARRNNINLIKKNNTLYIDSKEDVKTITNKVLKYRANKLNIDIEDLKDNEHTKQNKVSDKEKELYEEMIDSKDQIILSLKKDKEDLNKQIKDLHELLKQQQQLLYNQQTLTLKDKDYYKNTTYSLDSKRNTFKNTLTKISQSKKKLLNIFFNI